MPPAKLTTTLSTKGQVILPKAARDRKNWRPGARLTVEETPDGLLLKAAPLFAPTAPDAAFGILKYDGPPISLEDMDEAVRREAKRHAGD